MESPRNRRSRPDCASHSATSFTCRQTRSSQPAADHVSALAGKLEAQAGRSRAHRQESIALTMHYWWLLLQTAHHLLEPERGCKAHQAIMQLQPRLADFLVPAPRLRPAYGDLVKCVISWRRLRACSSCCAGQQEQTPRQAGPHSLPGTDKMLLCVSTVQKGYPSSRLLSCRAASVKSASPDSDVPASASKGGILSGRPLCSSWCQRAAAQRQRSTWDRWYRGHLLSVKYSRKWSSERPECARKSWRTLAARYQKRPLSRPS